MTVALEFINVIVRIDAIRSKYRGGWDQFIVDHEHRIGPIAWFDDYLYREGAMNPLDIQMLIDEWIDAGLDVYRLENGRPVEWIDICVVEFFGPTLKCDWISFIDAGAYLTGTESGPVIGPIR